jgi:hypothetical protein
MTVSNGSIFVNDAKIISPDIMISTGVIHLIDQYGPNFLDYLSIIDFLR